MPVQNLLRQRPYGFCPVSQQCGKRREVCKRCTFVEDFQPRSQFSGVGKTADFLQSLFLTDLEDVIDQIIIVFLPGQSGVFPHLLQLRKRSGQKEIFCRRIHQSQSQRQVFHIQNRKGFQTGEKSSHIIYSTGIMGGQKDAQQFAVHPQTPAVFFPGACKTGSAETMIQICG